MLAATVLLKYDQQSTKADSKRRDTFNLKDCLDKKTTM